MDLDYYDLEDDDSYPEEGAWDDEDEEDWDDDDDDPDGPDPY